ncbi:MAG: response regulator transcription factor [Pseudomonadota bacterium]
MTAARDLNAQGFLVTRAFDGESLVLFVRDAVQDAVVIDADLGDITTARAIRSIRVFRPNLPILALAKGADRALQKELYQAGADYVETAEPTPEELAARVRAAARRTAGYTMPLATLDNIIVDFDRRRVAVGDVPVALTPAEYEILEHLTLHRKSVVSRDNIMTHLYGLEDGPDPKILDVHTTRIRKKLRTAGADPKQLRTVTGQGYALDGSRKVLSVA